MRALTIWQPQAWAIAEGHKPVENRTWPFPRALMGERIAIHAGKRFDRKWEEAISDRFGIEVPGQHEIPSGAIVATAQVLGQIDETMPRGVQLTSRPFSWHPSSIPLSVIKDIGHSENEIYEWFSGPYGFLFAGVRKLRVPIFCRGAQGLWVVPPEMEWGGLANMKEEESSK